MNGIIAKIFGFLMAFLSLTVIVVVGLAILSDNLIPQDTGIDRTYITFGTILIALVYVIVIGSLSVSIHTRELAEEQSETLKQILFQLKQQNSIQGSSPTEKKKEPQF